jgi:hypothetical protein
MLNEFPPHVLKITLLASCTAETAGANVVTDKCITLFERSGDFLESAIGGGRTTNGLGS